MLGQAHGHPAELLLQLLSVGDVPLVGLLVADGNALRGHLERSRIDTSGTVAEERSDLAGQKAPERGATPGSRRMSNGARKDASRPSGTTVRPPGFRWSLAILATTLQDATPSEAVRLVAPRTEVRTASASARASPKLLATSPRSR